MKAWILESDLKEFQEGKEYVFTCIRATQLDGYVEVELVGVEPEEKEELF